MQVESGPGTAHKFQIQVDSFCLPFTPKFLQINSPPLVFVFFFVIFTGIRCGSEFFFVTPMRSSGGRVDTAQKPNKSGQILDQRWKIFFCNFYEIHSNRGYSLFACNLTWWAVLGFQDSMKQQEIRRNTGKKTKNLRKKKPKIQQKQPRFCGGFSGPFFTIKLGIF